MKIWFLPIEPLQQRYTEQMYRWVVSALEVLKLDYEVVEGDERYDAIQHGEWLDTTQTSIWKLDQIRSLSRKIANGDVHRGDLILLGDVWMPGIEAVKFQSELLRLGLRIGGWHYAGCFDHFDYLARGLSCWGPKYETSLIEGVLDSVAFGSRYHRDFVKRHCRLPKHEFHRGLAWDHDEVSASVSVRRRSEKKIIAYTHRIAPEKRPGEFAYLASKHRHVGDVQFAISTNGTLTKSQQAWADENAIAVVQHDSKQAYYEWLATCTAVWSGADQETFGYSFMEAVALGVPVIAPLRACYEDHFLSQGLNPTAYLYDEDDPCGGKLIEQAMLGMANKIPWQVSRQYQNSHRTYIKEFVEAYA